MNDLKKFCEIFTASETIAKQQKHFRIPVGGVRSKDDFGSYKWHLGWNAAIERCRDILLKMPVADVVCRDQFNHLYEENLLLRNNQKMTSRWIGSRQGESYQGRYECYQCENCGHLISFREYNTFCVQDLADYMPEEQKVRFCSHCGARMVK